MLTSTAKTTSRTTVYLELSRSAKSSSFCDRVCGAFDTTPTILSIFHYTALHLTSAHLVFELLLFYTDVPLERESAVAIPTDKQKITNWNNCPN